MRTIIVGALLNKEMREKRRALLWLGLASVIVLFFVFFARLMAGGGADNAQGLMQFWFGAIGVYLASEAFAELKKQQTAQAYLLVPASSAEKVAAKIIAYTLGWFVVYVGCWIVSALLATLAFMLFKGAVSIGLALSQLGSVFYTISTHWYFLLFAQSAALFASVYFRRLALLKAIIACGVIGLIYTIIATGEAFFLYQGMQNLQIDLTAQGKIVVDGVVGSTFDGALNVLSIIVRTLCIPALWAMTWLRLRETEAR